MEKRLNRSRTSRVMTGVCGGLGEYFRCDPVWVRLAFVAALFVIPPVALVGYLALWIAVPRGPAPQRVGPPPEDGPLRGPELESAQSPAKPGWGPVVAGVLLVLLGLSFFVPGGFFHFWDVGARYLGAAALALVAASLIRDQVRSADYRLFPVSLAAVLATLAVYLVLEWPGWHHWGLYFRYLANLVPAGLILGGLHLLTRRLSQRFLVALVAVGVLAFVGVYSIWGGAGSLLGWDRW